MATFIVDHPSTGILDVEYLHEDGTWKDVSLLYSHNQEYIFPSAHYWPSRRMRFTIDGSIPAKYYMDCSVSKASGLEGYPTKNHISDTRIEYNIPSEWNDVIGRIASFDFSIKTKPALDYWGKYNVLYGFDGSEAIGPTGSVDASINLEGFTKAEEVICAYPYGYSHGFEGDPDFEIQIEADITDILKGFDITVVFSDTIQVQENLEGYIYPIRKTQTIHIDNPNGYYHLEIPYYYCPKTGPEDIPVSTPDDVNYMGRFKKRTYGTGTDNEVYSDGGPLKNYYLTNDIDMAGWTVPKREIFNLDGRGFTIKNLTLENGDEDFIHFQSNMPV